MGGSDKALLPLDGRPLLAHVVAALQPQVDAILINSNRAAAAYAAFGLPVIADAMPDQPGPLAGILTALRSCTSDYVLVVPCDTPHLPADLVARMRAALERDDADACSIDDGTQLHAVVLLLRRTAVLPALERYLAAGHRRVQEWLHDLNHTTADYSTTPGAFVNVNTPDELRALEQPQPGPVCPTPIISFVAPSGTGKTTLLERLIPELHRRGLRIAALKHTHHLFDVDQPGKDSHRLRSAGAHQVLLASRRRWALITELEDDHPEPRLAELLQALDHPRLDLIVIEGFNNEPIPKVELHRPALGKPLICGTDPHLVAVAGDQPPAAAIDVPLLDINDPAAIADFIVARVIPAHSAPQP